MEARGVRLRNCCSVSGDFVSPAGAPGIGGYDVRSMMYYESAKQFVVAVIAVALQATVAVVERMPPYRPD